MNGDAVSPVVGIMLMMLLTVAVAVFVVKTGVDLAGTLEKTSMPIFTVERVNSTHVRITLYSASGAQNIGNCRIKYRNVEVCGAWNFNIGVARTCRTGSGPGDMYLICNVDGEDRVVLKAWI